MFLILVFLHLGFVDGIYLKFGGYEYSDLDKKQLQKPYVTLILFQTVVAVCVIFGGMILKDDALIFFCFFHHTIEYVKFL